MGKIKNIGGKQYQQDDAGDWYEVPVSEPDDLQNVDIAAWNEEAERISRAT